LCCAALAGAGCPKFLVREALGPFKLDLGDILYAPNTLVDLGKVAGWHVAGCKCALFYLCVCACVCVCVCVP